MAGAEFIDHKGKKIFHIDFVNAPINDIKDVIAKSKPVISSQDEGTLLTMTDVTGQKVTPTLSNLMKDFVRHNKPYVKAGAVIGVAGILKITFNAVLLFSGRRNLHLFDSIDEAKDWLAEQ